MRRLIARLAAYRANPDPRAQAANTLALLLASNGPVYPIYLWFVVGSAAWPSLIPMVGVPVFAAVPAMMRRSRLGGTLLLLAIADFNTGLYSWLFGAPAGLYLFLLPCIALGLFFPYRQRWLAWGASAVPLGLFVLLSRHMQGLLQYSAVQYAHLFTLSSYSVATLTWFMMVTFCTMTREA